MTFPTGVLTFTLTPDEDNLTVGLIVGDLTTKLGLEKIPGEDVVTVFVVVVVTRPVGFEVVTVFVTLNPPPPPRLIVDLVCCVLLQSQEFAKKLDRVSELSKKMTRTCFLCTCSVSTRKCNQLI